MIDTGLTRITRLPLDRLSSIAVAGESAVEVAGVLAAAGGPPLRVEADHFALLSESDPVAVPARIRDLPAGTVDLVVLRRAWRSTREILQALRAAKEVVRSGGEVMAADLDVNRLLAGPSTRYPARLLYLTQPEAGIRLAESTASPMMLGLEAVRAGLVEVDSLTYDDVRSTHDSVSEMWESIRDRGWRGAAWTPHDRQTELFEEVAIPMAGAIPVGPAVDREPWYVVAGKKR